MPETFSLALASASRILLPTAHSEPRGSLSSTSFQPSAAELKILLADRGARLKVCARLRPSRGHRLIDTVLSNPARHSAVSTYRKV